MNTTPPKDGTRPAHAGETDTTRFGMEDGDNTDMPATGLDPDQQAKPTDAEEEAAKLGDFA